MAFLKEAAASVSISVKSIPRRASMAMATIVGVALVVMVLLGFLSMADGFRRTVEGAGAEDVAILLSKGARAEVDSVISLEAQRQLDDAPGVALQSGRRLASAEVYTIVAAPGATDGDLSNIPLRGIGADGLRVRSGFALSQGRMFTPGTQEIVIGRALQRRAGFELGRRIRFGPTEWTIVGIVTAKGSALESEIWGDLRTVQSIYRNDSSVQSVRLRLASPSSSKTIQDFLAVNSRLQLELTIEREYFANQSRGLTNLMRYLGWPLAILMALGALAAALNTMHSSVAARASEIATLRTIGFGATSTFVAVLAEALALAAFGAALGVLGSLLLFQGLTASTVSGSMTELSFTLQVSWRSAVAAVILALTVGLIGGIVAAWRAARQTILAGLVNT